MKRIVRLTESDLVKLVKKVLKEQSDPLEGWDKLKEGQKIVLKSDKDGKITSWIVDATSPNPGRSGKGTKLFLYPDGAESRKITSDAIEVSFFPKEMKVDMFNGMNSIVKDAINPPKKPISSIPSKPTFVKGKLPKNLRNLIIIKSIFPDEIITAVKPDLKVKQTGFEQRAGELEKKFYVAVGKTWDGLDVRFGYLECGPIRYVVIDNKGLPYTPSGYVSSSGFEFNNCPQG
jgi:hypothetical protein